MAAITGIAEKFFEACETGKGWDACKEYCMSDATFSAQSEPLAVGHDIQGDSEWRKGLRTFLALCDSFPLRDGAVETRIGQPL